MTRSTDKKRAKARAAKASGDGASVGSSSTPPFGTNGLGSSSSSVPVFGDASSNGSTFTFSSTPMPAKPLPKRGINKSNAKTTGDGFVKKEIIQVSSSGSESENGSEWEDGDVEMEDLTIESSPSHIANGANGKKKVPDVVDESKEIKAERIKEEGNDWFRKGGMANWEKAEQRYQKAIQLVPENSSYHSNRAAALVSLRRFREALLSCQTAISLSHFDTLPTSTRSKTLLRAARCHLALAEAPAALAQLSIAQRFEPGNVAIRSEIMKAELVVAHLENVKRKREEGDWSMVLFALDKLEREGGVEQAPAQWRSWRLEALINRERWDEARGLATDLLRGEPSNPEFLYLRGLVMYHGDGNTDQAISHARAALQSDPDFTKARLLMRTVKNVETLKAEGNEFYKKKNQEGAIQKYTEALNLDLKNKNIRIILLQNRAFAYRQLNKDDLALEDLESVLTMNPDQFKALRTRARIYVSRERYQEAIQDFKKAVQSHSGGQDEIREIKREIQETELLLKKQSRKDYYKILGGLSESAGQDEIKKAYRKESLKHHPDKGGDEAKFKELGEAYAILSDPERRRRYDAGYDESDPSSGMGGMDEMFGGFGGGGHPFEEMFSSQFGGGGFRYSSGGNHFHSFSSGHGPRGYGF